MDGKEEILELTGAIQRSRVENYVVMNMRPVNMRRNDKGVIAFQEAHGKLSPNLVCFLRCNLSGLK